VTTDTHISEREREILRLIATGATNQQIARELSISVNTVKVHVRNIFTKIGAVSRAEAVMFAVRSGIVRVDEVSDAGGVPPERSEEGIDLAAVADAPAGEALPDAPVSTPSDQSGDARAESIARVRRGVSRRSLIIGGGLVLAGAALATAASIIVRPIATPIADPARSPSPGPARRWRELASLPAGRAGFALATAAFDGRSFLLAIGGEAETGIVGQVFRYDVGGDLWVPMSPKPTPVCDIRAAMVGGLVYVPGGRTTSGEITSVVETYDPQRDTWSTSAPLPSPRAACAVAAIEGKLYVIGGWDGTEYRADVWQFDPDDGVWRVRTPMPTARAYAASGAADQQVYVIGGLNRSGNLSVNERYSPSVDRPGPEPWSTRAPISIGPVEHDDAASVGGLAMLIGAGGAAGQLLVYNPQSDAWVSGQIPLSESRDARAAAIGGKLYLVGGRTGKELSRQAFEYQAISTVFLPVVS
jgi:DNA-binding CsgD family transcriptional regulator